MLTSAVLAAVGAFWVFARDAFLAQGHFVATIAFFALFAAVAVLNAFPRRQAPPPPVFRVLYIAIAVALVGRARRLHRAASRRGASGMPVVLLAEAAALSLFFAFWVVQGIEKWDDADPRIAAER